MDSLIHPDCCRIFLCNRKIVKFVFNDRQKTYSLAKSDKGNNFVILPQLFRIRIWRSTAFGRWLHWTERSCQVHLSVRWSRPQQHCHRFRIQRSRCPAYSWFSSIYCRKGRVFKFMSQLLAYIVRDLLSTQRGPVL